MIDREVVELMGTMPVGRFDSSPVTAGDILVALAEAAVLDALAAVEHGPKSIHIPAPELLDVVVWSPVDAGATAALAMGVTVGAYGGVPVVVCPHCCDDNDALHVGYPHMGYPPVALSS